MQTISEKQMTLVSSYSGIRVFGAVEKPKVPKRKKIIYIPKNEERGRVWERK